MERGERGSSEEYLTVTQFKVHQEQARLAEFTEQNRQQEKQAATLGSKIEKIQNQRVDVRSIEKIVATSIPFSSKVAMERENTELRGKVRSYEDVIQRNNLWRFFHPLREKAVTRDEAR